MNRKEMSGVFFTIENSTWSTESMSSLAQQATAFWDAFSASLTCSDVTTLHSFSKYEFNDSVPGTEVCAAA